MNKQLIIPEFRLVAFQEDGWDEDFLKKCGGSILSVYMYDYKQVTHLCEVTGSYYLRLVEILLGIQYDDNEELYDHLQAEALSASDAFADYFHCRTIDSIPFPSENHHLLGYPTEEELGETSYEELAEGWFEYARCNGGLYAGEGG